MGVRNHTLLLPKLYHCSNRETTGAIQGYIFIQYIRQALCLFYLACFLSLQLHWSGLKNIQGGKPVQVRWARIVCKMMELLLGSANWTASFGEEDHKLMLDCAKGVITALETPIKGSLIVKYLCPWTYSSHSDRMVRPVNSCSVHHRYGQGKLRLWIAEWGDGDGEKNVFLPFMRLGAKYEMLTKKPYPGRGLDLTEKVRSYDLSTY